MDEKHGKVEQDEFNVTELDDKELETVAGGGPNGNCGCGGYSFSGEEGAANGYCGCPGSSQLMG